MGSYRDSVRALQDVIAPLFDALERGLEVAADHHADRDFIRGDDPWYFAHTARRVALERLRGSGIQAENVDTGRPLLAMSGLMLFHRNLAVRVLHTQAKDGTGQAEIPIPGRSAPRQQFWRQEPALPELRTDNHLLLWHDVEGALVDPMTLVRPLGGDHTRSSLTLDWVGPLSRDMDMLRAADLDELRPDYQWGQLGQEES